MKTELEMFWKHVKLCFKSKQLVRNWGHTAGGGHWSRACGVISVSSRLAGTSSESFRHSLLTVTGMNSLFSNHLSGRRSWLDSLECLQHWSVQSIPLSGNTHGILTCLYVTCIEPECLLHRFVTTNFLSKTGALLPDQVLQNGACGFTFLLSCQLFFSPACSQGMWFSKPRDVSLCMHAKNIGCSRPTLDFHFQPASALGDAALLLVLEVVNLTFLAWCGMRSGQKALSHIILILLIQWESEFDVFS